MFHRWNYSNNPVDPLTKCFLWQHSPCLSLLAVQASYREFVVGNFETLMCRVGGRRAGAHRVIFLGLLLGFPVVRQPSEQMGLVFHVFKG